jgi:hypothetical protein
MVDQLASGMAAVALTAVLLLTAFFQMDRLPEPSRGNQPGLYVAVRR